MKMIKHTVWIMTLLLVSGCLSMPKTVTPVQGFELERYLGKWYEIARLDHPFERGLEQVTAEYQLRDGGGVTVTNRGLDTATNQFKETVGKARLVNGPDEGYLKVSFFGPFYGSYVIFELDKDNYDYAFVSGPDLSYLWLLSRKKEVAPAVLARFIAQAKQKGFNTDELIFVKHN